MDIKWNGLTRVISVSLAEPDPTRRKGLVQCLWVGSGSVISVSLAELDPTRRKGLVQCLRVGSGSVRLLCQYNTHYTY